MEERRRNDFAITERFDKFIEVLEKKTLLDDGFFKQTIQHMNEETGQLDKIDARMNGIENDLRDLKQQIVLDTQKSFDGLGGSKHVAHHHRLEEFFSRQDQKERLDQEGKSHIKWNWVDRIGMWILGLLIVGIQIVGPGPIFAHQHNDPQKQLVETIDKLTKKIEQLTPIP